jgi:hypothetical protein
MKWISKKFGIVKIVFVWRTYIHLDNDVIPYAYIGLNDRSNEFIRDLQSANPGKKVSLQKSVVIFIAWAHCGKKLLSLPNTSELWAEVESGDAIQAGQLIQPLSSARDTLIRMESRINNL